MKHYPDGIYFNMSADEYHAIQRLSCSGIQKLMASPAAFWKESRLNPDKPDQDEDATKEQILGRAYHTALLEPHLFADLYVREPSEADYGGDLLTNSTQIGEALGALKQTKKGAGESAVDQAKRLRDAGHEGPIWSLIMHEFREELGGRQPIKAEYWAEIQRDVERLRAVPDVSALLTGGEAEVVILWTTEEGTPMKARLDYLRAADWSDFKTFDNIRGKELEQCIADAYRYNRYYVQRAVYHEAVEALRGGLPVIGESATPEQREMVAAIQERDEPLDSWFIYQEKNGVPNVLARRYPAEGALFAKGQIAVARARAEYNLYATVYVSGEPWNTIRTVADVDEGLFNRFWLEGAE